MDLIRWLEPALGEESSRNENQTLILGRDTFYTFVAPFQRGDIHGHEHEGQRRRQSVGTRTDLAIPGRY